MLRLLFSYLIGMNLRVVVSGSTSTSFPMEAFNPQVSVLGPILRNIHFSDFLQIIPAASAYPDDCTLSRTYKREEAQDVIKSVNSQLADIMTWIKRWQVKYAFDKIHAMEISPSWEDARQLHGRVRLGNDTVPLQASVEVLGVRIESQLRFDRLLERVVKKPSRR